MLYTIGKGNVDGYPASQDSIIYITSSAQAVAQAGLRFVFTDGHAIMSFTRTYDDLSQLNRVDWDLMNARLWYDTSSDSDRKRRRQAEFLVREQFPWYLVDMIVVKTERMKKTVEALLANYALATPVVVERSWYY